MVTPMNLELLEETGFPEPEIASSTPLDMVVALRAASEKAHRPAEAELAKRSRAAARSPARAGGPRAYATLSEAVPSTARGEPRHISVPAPTRLRGPPASTPASTSSSSHNVVPPTDVAQEARPRPRPAGHGPDCGRRSSPGWARAFANRVPAGASSWSAPRHRGIQTSPAPSSTWARASATP
jgi:hypothetical protein